MLALLLAFGEPVVDNSDGDPIFGWSFGEWVVGLIVIFVVVIVAAWALRKFGIL